MTEPTRGAATEVDVIRRQARKAWTWFEETVTDVSADEANWRPPGTANSIGTTYLHVVINTDVEINRLIFAREPLVESRWGGDVGQGVPYDPERFDAWAGQVGVDWTLLREYGRAVHEHFLGSLEDVTDVHMNMAVDMTRSGLGVWEGRALYELHGSNHPHIHGGEIACLKGLLGGIGWAESDSFRAPAPFKT